MTDPDEMLYDDRYKITKRDGSPIDPKAQYFVLRLDSDACAREAARVYASCVQSEHPMLALELRMLVRRLSEKAEDKIGGRDD